MKGQEYLDALKRNQADAASRKHGEPKAPPPTPGVITFHVPGPPVPKGSMRGYLAERADGTPRIGLKSDNDALHAWSKAVSAYAALHRPHEPWGGAVKVSLGFRILRPKSVPKSRVWPEVKPDLDKLSRAILDALKTAGVFVDDGQVCWLECSKVYGDPGVSVRVERAP